MSRRTEQRRRRYIRAKPTRRARSDRSLNALTDGKTSPRQSSVGRRSNLDWANEGRGGRKGTAVAVPSTLPSFPPLIIALLWQITHCKKRDGGRADPKSAAVAAESMDNSIFSVCLIFDEVAASCNKRSGGSCPRKSLYGGATAQVLPPSARASGEWGQSH